MSTAAPRTGRCLCNKVQYKLEGPSATPLWNTVCHCTNCLRLGGSPNFASICPKEGFSIIQGEELIKTYSGETTDSGNVLHRQFCSNCGTKLFALTPLAEHIVSVAAGSLDDFDQWRPDKEQYCMHRPAFLEKVKGVDRQYRHTRGVLPASEPEAE